MSARASMQKFCDVKVCVLVPLSEPCRLHGRSEVLLRPPGDGQARNPGVDPNRPGFQNSRKGGFQCRDLRLNQLVQIIALPPGGILCPRPDDVRHHPDRNRRAPPAGP